MPTEGMLIRRMTLECMLEPRATLGQLNKGVAGELYVVEKLLRSI